MSERYTYCDPEKLEDLKTKLNVLKEAVETIQTAIQTAIDNAHEIWDDPQFIAFSEAYDGYKKQVGNVATDFDTFANTTLPPIIEYAKNIEEKNLHR